MERHTILLVEDDFLNRRLARKVLAENGYDILEAKNAKEAIDQLDGNKNNIDLVILDINLGEQEQDGISIGKRIQERQGIPFIYLTAYDNDNIVNRAIETTPYSYITKPFKNIEILSTVTLAIRQYKQKGSPTIVVKEDEYNVELAIEEIQYIESDGNYLLFHTQITDKVFKSRSTIKQVLEILPRHTFIQTHRAFVVNKHKIQKFNTKTVIVNNVPIPLSRNYVAEITSLITDRT